MAGRGVCDCDWRAFRVGPGAGSVTVHHDVDGFVPVELEVNVVKLQT